MTALFGSPEFWVLVSFLILVAALWRFGVHRRVLAMIDAYRAQVASELDEATRLRDEALADREAARKILEGADAEARALIAEAQAQAQAFALRVGEDMKHAIARRERAAQAQAARALDEARADLAEETVALASQAALTLIAALPDEDADALTDKAIESAAVALARRDTSVLVSH